MALTKVGRVLPWLEQSFDYHISKNRHPYNLLAPLHANETKIFSNISKGKDLEVCKRGSVQGFVLVHQRQFSKKPVSSHCLGLQQQPHLYSLLGWQVVKNVLRLEFKIFGNPLTLTANGDEQSMARGEHQYYCIRPVA